MNERRDTTLVRVARTKEFAHQSAIEAYAQMQTLIGLGKRAKLTVEEDEDDISAKQRGFLHKAVFPQIAEQVVLPAELGGGRLDWRVWKELNRARFLGDKWVMRKLEPRWDAKKGRIVRPRKRTPMKVRISTEDLGIRAYSDYIDTVIDNAVADYGVEFRFIAAEREEVRWKPTPRKAKQQEAEAAPA